MEEEKFERRAIDPYAVAGGFVFNWDTLIEPALKEGNYTPAQAVIINSCLEFDCINTFDREKITRDLPAGAYAAYRMALTYLRALTQDEKEWKGKINLESYLRNVGIFIDKLDMVLQGDEVFDLNRRRK